MTILIALYWIILALCVLGGFAPPNSVYFRWNWVPFVALFVIIGLKSFRTPLQLIAAFSVITISACQTAPPDAVNLNITDPSGKAVTAVGTITHTKTWAEKYLGSYIGGLFQ